LRRTLFEAQISAVDVAQSKVKVTIRITIAATTIELIVTPSNCQQAMCARIDVSLQRASFLTVVCKPLDKEKPRSRHVERCSETDVLVPDEVTSK
jgi:hypothetical protein